MTHTMQFRPMRPGLSIPRLDQYDGPLPEGWHWQPKLDDERGVIERTAGDGCVIYNRHGQRLATHKALAFVRAASDLLERFPDQDLFDVALLGFRGKTFPLGTIALLDLPKVNREWFYRRDDVIDVTPGWRPDASPPGLVVHLKGVILDRSGVYSYFASTQNIPGIEGLIGRDPAALYQQGDSKAMCKIKW